MMTRQDLETARKLYATLDSVEVTLKSLKDAFRLKVEWQEAHCPSHNMSFDIMNSPEGSAILSILEKHLFEQKQEVEAKLHTMGFQ